MNWTEDYISPYTPFTFTSEQTNENRVSAKNLNTLGNQLTAGTYLISHHNHDDQYYTQSESYSKYFSNNNKSGSDADTIDGFHFSDLIGGAIPQYGIIAWESSTIPAGYAICNGQVVNRVSTPDMRDYFTPCAGNTFLLNDIFGSNTINYSGNVTIANHTLIEAELANHTHSYYDIYGVNVNNAGGTSAYYRGHRTTSNSTVGRNSGATGGGQGHGHPGSTISLNQNVDNRPSYYSLLYIMKVVS